jgi:hypothetical protein
MTPIKVGCPFISSASPALRAGTARVVQRPEVLVAAGANVADGELTIERYLDQIKRLCDGLITLIGQ